MKRLIDVTAATAGLILLSPVLGVVAFLVRISMGPPVIFRQDRPGLHGELFTIMKFRTMRDPVDNSTDDDAGRITPLGAFLRRSSLDELPELWNVLKGDMSLVGPRPLLPQYLERYDARQARRHEVRPGITGWAQVNGRNAAPWEQRLEQDIWYVENCTLLLDIKILWRTARSVFAQEGIQAEGHATMPEFDPTIDGDTSPR